MCEYVYKKYQCDWMKRGQKTHMCSHDQSIYGEDCPTPQISMIEDVGRNCKRCNQLNVLQNMLNNRRKNLNTIRATAPQDENAIQDAEAKFQDALKQVQTQQFVDHYD